MFVIINFIVDLLYQLVDPQLRGRTDLTTSSPT
jgi:ABC-type dipeptide/oligopeptide/nickel transport system permease component